MGDVKRLERVAKNRVRAEVGAVAELVNAADVVGDGFEGGVGDGVEEGGHDRGFVEDAKRPFMKPLQFSWHRRGDAQFVVVVGKLLKSGR